MRTLAAVLFVIVLILITRGIPCLPPVTLVETARHGRAAQPAPYSIRVVPFHGNVAPHRLRSALSTLRTRGKGVFIITPALGMVVLADAEPVAESMERLIHAMDYAPLPDSPVEDDPVDALFRQLAGGDGLVRTR